MSDCMTQEDAMNMNNEQAIKILKPFMNMMRDQNGCPISDAYFALGKAIDALEPQRMRGRWERTVIGKARHIICSSCKVGYYAQDVPHDLSGNVAWKYCPNCGADMRESK